MKIVDSLDGADGVILVYDVIHGMPVADETLLRQALMAGKRASLFIDNLDKALATMDSEDVYQACMRATENVNVVLCMPARSEEEAAEYYAKWGHLGDLQVLPQSIMGTVAFGSAEQGWGFTLRHFGKLYARKMGVVEKQMTERLWGDNFFWAMKKRWVDKQEQDGVQLRRAVCQFVFDPVKQMSEAVLSGDDTRAGHMMKALGISLSSSDQALSGQPLLTRVMQSWMANDHLSLLIVPLKERVLSSFQKFDKNADGRISTSELSAVMQHLDPTWSGGDLSKLMAKADSNGDGTLDPMEFVQFVFSPSR